MIFQAKDYKCLGRVFVRRYGFSTLPYGEGPRGLHQPWETLTKVDFSKLFVMVGALGHFGAKFLVTFIFSILVRGALDIFFINFVLVVEGSSGMPERPREALASPGVKGIARECLRGPRRLWKAFREPYKAL